MKKYPTIVIAIILLLVAVMIAAGQGTGSLNEKKLEQAFKTFSRTVPTREFGKKYPGISQKIRSKDIKEQVTALKMIAASEDPAGIPWVSQLLSAKDLNVRITAASSLRELVYSLAIRRRDSTFQGMVILKPERKGDAKLGPVTWLALKLIKSDEPSIVAAGITTARYLNAYELEPLITERRKSDQPAVANTAEWALEALRLQKRYEMGKLKS